MGHRTPHTEVGDGDAQTRPVHSTTDASFLNSRQVSATQKPFPVQSRPAAHSCNCCNPPARGAKVKGLSGASELRYQLREADL